MQEYKHLNSNTIKSYFNNLMKDTKKRTIKKKNALTIAFVFTPL